MTSTWIGIDLGTQSVRAASIDERGVTHITSAPLTSRRSADRHEQDPAEWLEAVAAALGRLVDRLGPHADIRALAVSGTSGTIVPVDSLGRATGPAVMYDDARGRPHLELVQERGAALWNRLGYRMQASWGLPKILTMRDESAFTAGEVFAHQPDVVTSWLAGRRLPSDLSSALKSGADLDAIRWPDQLLDELGLSGRVDEVVASGARIGEVSDAAAAATGLPGGCAIIAGMTDGCAAQIASGALLEGDWNSVLGTTLVLKGSAHRRRTDPSGAVYAHRAPFDSGWYPGGASSTGARAVAELMDGDDLEAATTDARARDAVPVAYPLIGVGERFPFVAADARGFGPDDAPLSSLPPGERLAAIAWGTAFVERLAFDLVERVGYDVSGRIYTTGGGSRNTWWNTVRASTLHKPLYLPDQQEGAIGMALLASAAHDPSVNGGSLAERAGALLRPPTIIDPSLARTSAIDDAFERFVEQLRARGWLAASTAAEDPVR